MECQYKGYFTNRIDASNCPTNTFEVRKSFFKGLRGANKGGAICVEGTAFTISILATGFTNCVITGTNFGGAIYGDVLQSNVSRVCFDLCESAGGDNAFHLTNQKQYSNTVANSNAFRCCANERSDGRLGN